MNGLPRQIKAGLSFSATIDAAENGADWSATLFLRGPSSIDLAGAAVDEGWEFRASAATAAGWKPGVYTYAVRAGDDWESVELASGTVEILADITQLPDGSDVRGQWRIGLDAIEAVLGKRASMDQERYRINNRELYRTPISDLIKLRDFYAQKVAEESGASRRGRFGSIPVRFRQVGR